MLRVGLHFGEAHRDCLQDVDNVTFSRTFSSWYKASLAQRGSGRSQALGTMGTRSIQNLFVVLHMR